jgi:hypothetical protein
MDMPIRIYMGNATPLGHSSSTEEAASKINSLADSVHPFL